MRGRGERGGAGGGRGGEREGGRRGGRGRGRGRGREVTFSTYIRSRRKEMIAKSRVFQCLNYFRRLLWLLSAGPESVDGILIKSVIIPMKAIDQFFPVDGGCIGNLNPLTPENFYVFE